MYFRLCLVGCKIFSGKKNIFKCLVAFQKMFWKIFSGVWLCSWKYQRKHIFYLLLTFSQLLNKYIISFLNIEIQKKQNSEKKFIKFGQYRNTKETKPRKKNSSNPIKLREEGRERGDWVRSRGDIARRRRDRVVLESIFAWSARCRDRQDRSSNWSLVWGVRCCGRRTGARSEDWALSLFLSLSLHVSPEMVWSENFHFKPFSGQSY